MSNIDSRQFDETQPYAPGNPEPPKSGGWWKGCLIGCLAVGAISAVICAGVGYYAVNYGPPWLINQARDVLAQVLQESKLPDEEQNAILTQYDRVGEAYLAGDLPLEDLGLMVQDLATSPLIPALLVQVVSEIHVDKSGLNADEKAEAKDTLQRVYYGIMEERFEASELDALMKHVRENPDSQEPGDQLKIKDSFTDDELRALLADAKQLCDEKEIPLADTDVKISEKLKEVIDKRLGPAE